MGRLKEIRDTIFGVIIFFLGMTLAIVFRLICCIYYQRNCDKCGRLCDIKSN